MSTLNATTNRSVPSNAVSLHRVATPDAGNIPLTVEELLAKCESTMRNLDDQLRTRMSQQDKRNGSLSALAQASQAISNTKTPPGDKAPQADKDAYATSIHEAQAALNALADQNPAIAEQLRNAANALDDRASATPDGKKNASDIVSTSMDSFRNDNETAMIEIQSIISKRSQALQMTSNMVNSLNESAKSLIQNIR